MYLEEYEFNAVDAISAYDANVFDKDTNPYAAVPILTVTNDVRKKLIK